MTNDSQAMLWKAEQDNKQAQDQSANNQNNQQNQNLLDSAFGKVMEVFRECKDGLVYGNDKQVAEQICKRLGEEVGAQHARDFAEGLAKTQEDSRARQEEGIKQCVNAGVELLKDLVKDYEMIKGKEFVRGELEESMHEDLRLRQK